MHSQRTIAHSSMISHAVSFLTLSPELKTNTLRRRALKVEYPMLPTNAHKTVLFFFHAGNVASKYEAQLKEQNRAVGFSPRRFVQQLFGNFRAANKQRKLAAWASKTSKSRKSDS